MSWMILFKKQLFDLEVKGQGPMKVITVRDTPPYGHAPTYQISLTYLERQRSYGLDKLHWEEAEEAEAEEKFRLKQYVSLRLKGRHNNIFSHISLILLIAYLQGISFLNLHYIYPPLDPLYKIIAIHTNIKIWFNFKFNIAVM